MPGLNSFGGERFALVTACLLVGLTSTSGHACTADDAPLFTRPGFSAFDPHQTFRSVGPFGSFGKGSELQERDHVGLLTFTLRKDAPDNTLVWANLTNGKDFVLGHAGVPGRIQAKKFEFLDWTTARLAFSTDSSQKTDVIFSRSFPAVLYDTQSHEWKWKPGDLHADWIAYRDPMGRMRTTESGKPIGALGSPWVVLWPNPGPGVEVAPLLVRFERKPVSLRLTTELDAEFDRAAGCIAVMPLTGVRRFTGDAAKVWSGKLPAWVPIEADRWSRMTAAFPIGLTESFALNDARGAVRITDRMKYRLIADEWGTKPFEATPVSPVTALAQRNGYPVNWIGRKIERSQVATLLGPYAYAPGSEFSYEIPVPSARDNALAPIRVEGDSARQKAALAVNVMVRERTMKPDDTSDGGLNLQLKEYAQSYRLFDDSTKRSVGPEMAAAFAASYLPKNLQTVTDPVTGVNYVMCSKIWCAGEAYDREWYAGRQLDAAAEYSAWVDPKPSGENWTAIQGLYAYFRIYSDWAWSGTLSSLFAYALCADGMNFAMEGMLGVARMAKQHGDIDLWRDASYRASKEALCTYSSWFLTDWVKSVDYVTWTDTSYDYQAKRGRYEIKRMDPADVQTGFGLDIFSDTTGVKVFRPGSYWHATAAVYWNNMSLDRLYLEYLYPHLRKWEFETLSKLHPSWTDRTVMETFSNQPYGSNFVLTHLDARSTLFGQSPTELAELTTKLQPDIAFLYRLRAAQDMVESGVPQLWLPTADAWIADSVWDARALTATSTLQPRKDGRLTLDWRWPGRTPIPDSPDAGPKPAAVTVNGKHVPFHRIEGGFWRASIDVKATESVVFSVRYR